MGNQTKKGDKITSHKSFSNISLSLEISNAFADYFSNIALDEIQSVCLQIIPTFTSADIEIKVPLNGEPISEEYVIENLYDIKNETSSGVDGMSIITLNQIIPCIVNPFTYMINQSFIEGILTISLKKALASPLYKKGDNNDITN